MNRRHYLLQILLILARYMPKKCLACGNNPVSHLSSWWSQSFLIFMNPLSMLVAGRLLDRFFNLFFKFFFNASIWMFRITKSLRMNSDIEKVPGLRGKVLWQEAKRRGIPIQSFVVWGNYLDSYQAIVKGKTINFMSLPRLPGGAEEWWLDDKAVLKKMLQAAGVPTPRGGSFTRYASLRAAFEKLEKPVIIKPRLGSRGRHTTTNIWTEVDLRKAYHSAKKLCHWVVMEEHLVGSVYRGTVIDGKLVGVLRGDPPRVTGDGVHTVEQLIDIKNEHRPSQISPVVVTDAHRDFLERQNITVSSILPQGKRIDLLEKIGVSYGGNSAEVTEITHPEIKRFLEMAGAVVHDSIIGFDFIIEHIDQSPAQQKWGIIECNGVPFINLHHYPVEGTPVNVAATVWDYVEKNISLF